MELACLIWQFGAKRPVENQQKITVQNNFGNSVEKDLQKSGGNFLFKILRYQHAELCAVVECEEESCIVICSILDHTLSEGPPG